MGRGWNSQGEFFWTSMAGPVMLGRLVSLLLPLLLTCFLCIVIDKDPVPPVSQLKHFTIIAKTASKHQERLLLTQRFGMNLMCPQAQAGTETHPDPEVFAKESPGACSVSILSAPHPPLKGQRGKPGVSVKQQRLRNQGPWWRDTPRGLCTGQRLRPNTSVQTQPFN